MAALRPCKVSTCRVLSKEKRVTGLPLTVALVGCPCTPSTRSVSSGGQEYPCVLVTTGGETYSAVKEGELRGERGREKRIVSSGVKHFT